MRIDSISEMYRLINQADIWNKISSSMLQKVNIKNESICADIGAGPIGLETLLNNFNGQIYSIDENLGYLKYKVKQSNDLLLINADVYQIPIKNNIFDLTYSRFLLSQCHDLDKAVKQIVRITKKDGFIIVQDMDWESIEYFPKDQILDDVIDLINKVYLTFGCNIFMKKILEQSFIKNKISILKVDSKYINFHEKNWYFYFPLIGIKKLKSYIIYNKLMNENDLDKLIINFDNYLKKVEKFQTFKLIQVVGKKE